MQEMATTVVMHVCEMVQCAAAKLAVSEIGIVKESATH